MLALVFAVGCTAEGPPKPTVPSTTTTTAPATSTPTSSPPTTPEQDPLGQALADAFRIDLADVDLTLAWTPDQELDGHVVLTFAMRPGQVRPLFHFVPPVDGARAALTAITLDGASLDPASDADLRPITIEGSRQAGFELQRDVDPLAPHTLAIDWSIAGPVPSSRAGWLYTGVDDIDGFGNDHLWPTINSPEDLATHEVELRIDAPVPYVVFGSSEPTSHDEGGVQVFDLAVAQPIASYTLMFAAVPADDVQVDRFDVGGLPVAIASTESPETAAAARAMVEAELPELEADFGPFPMPSLQILLIDWPSGMEFYGGTASGLSSLSHELVHMYWGCSAVNRTWRDTWFDEAVNVWYQYHQALPPLPDGYRSDQIGGRGVIELGFDTRAYDQGAVVLSGLAAHLGGDDAMLAFLRDLHDRRSFAPYTVDDLMQDAIDQTGDESLRADYQAWLFTP